MQNTQYIYRELKLDNIKKIGLLLLYALFVFYFLINGSALFQEWNDSWTYTTLIYLSGVSIFLVVSILEKSFQEFEKPLVQHIIGFLSSFLLVTALFLVLYDLGVYFQSVNPMPVGRIPAVMVYQLVVVVASEEIIFRGVVYRFFTKYFHWIIGVLVSALAFSLFHLAVYEGSLGALFTAFLMGLVLAWSVKRWNLGVAFGIHFAWNCFVLGVTVLI